MMENFLPSEVREKQTMEHTSEALGLNSCLLTYYSNTVVCECWYVPATLYALRLTSFGDSSPGWPGNYFVIHAGSSNS